MDMRIYEDRNGVVVNAISRDADGRDVEGHLYQILSGPRTTHLQFQTGGFVEHGLNGITNESLLVVVANRLRHLNGKFPCDENRRAIDGIENALANLELRTARRLIRGVEGQEVA